MSKKFQVFISSTFTDLREERQAAVEAVLLAQHIPAGMELFSAGDASQLQVIKEWIRESDIYLLILGARYGSIEPESGLGYTEIEYDFAVALGMPHFAVVLNDSAAARKREAGLVSEEGNKVATPLAAFRKKVLSKSSSFVDDPRDIKICVLQSLHAIERRPTLVGWVRPNDATNMAPLIGQLSELSTENSRLRAQLVESKRQELKVDLTVLNDLVTLTVQSQHKGYSAWHPKAVQITWRSLFGCMAIKLLAPTNDETLNQEVACFIGSFDPDDRDIKVRVRETDWETVKAQFLKLDFVNIVYGTTMAKTGALFWTLTQLGKEIGLVLRAPG